MKTPWHHTDLAVQRALEHALGMALVCSEKALDALDQALDQALVTEVAELALEENAGAEEALQSFDSDLQGSLCRDADAAQAQCRAALA